MHTCRCAQVHAMLSPVSALHDNEINSANTLVKLQPAANRLLCYVDELRRVLKDVSQPAQQIRIKNGKLTAFCYKIVSSKKKKAVILYLLDINTFFFFVVLLLTIRQSEVSLGHPPR